MENIEYNLQFEKLCAFLDIGELLHEPEPLKGGLLHRIYAVETSSGKYAIKALNPQIMLRPKARPDILNGERIAAYAARFIPSLPAKQFGELLIPEIDGQHYLVYDWVDGKSLYRENITTSHCKNIGSILGKIHAIDFSPLNIKKPVATVEAIVDWNEYLHKGQQANSPWIDELSQRINDLYDWNSRYLASMKYLENPLVIGHGDIDPKNVLWHDGQPIIIDWESAGYLNPAHEFIVYALYWSDSNKKNDKEKFLAFLRGYLSVSSFGTINWRVVMDAGLSPHWLEYSLKRSLGIEYADDTERKMGTEQVVSTLQYLNRYEAAIPQIVDWLKTYL